jgi:hypothetical protein
MTDPERKTLWGVQFFGWGLIITTLFHVHKMIFDYNFYMYYYSDLGRIAYLRYAFSAFQRIVGLSIGIGLLKEKEWARITGIVLGIFASLTVYWKHSYPAFLKHTRYLDQQFGYLLHQWAIPPGLTFESLTVPAMITHWILDILFWGVFIFYMTRPCVKERFR